MQPAQCAPPFIFFVACRYYNFLFELCNTFTFLSDLPTADCSLICIAVIDAMVYHSIGFSSSQYAEQSEVRANGTVDASTYQR
jgi:hypothetical protein